MDIDIPADIVKRSLEAFPDPQGHSGSMGRTRRVYQEGAAVERRLASESAGKADNRYVELEAKINRARQQDFGIVRTQDGVQCAYEAQRQEIIDRYFHGSYDGETKEQLLDMFEQVNEYIKIILGV